MKRNTCIRLLLGLLLACGGAETLPAAPPPGVRISPRNAEKLLSGERLREDVQFLADSLCDGRRTGTAGACMAAFWIAEQFRGMGLQPLGDSWFQGFETPAGETGHNVAALLPGSGSAGKQYVVVGAHFDNIGNLHGVLYPGADSNASGVAALLSLARMLNYMTRIDRPYRRSVIFVAFDGRESNLSGSREMMRRIRAGELIDPVTGKPVTRNQIELMVNLDQIGSSLAPLPSGRKDYLIMLADDKSTRKATLAAANARTGLDLGFSYYGSRDFTQIFYRRICDQRPFLEAGIESVLFTSGITLNNNKPYDDAGSLDYAVFEKRVLLLYYWLIRNL